MATSDFVRVLNGEVTMSGLEINKILTRGDKLVRLNEDGTYEGGESPLFIAIKYNAPDSVLNAIINYYPDDINKPTTYETGNNMNPLQFAISVENTRIENLLKKNGAVTEIPAVGGPAVGGPAGGGRRRKTNRKKSKRKKTKKRKTNRKKSKRRKTKKRNAYVPA